MASFLSLLTLTALAILLFTSDASGMKRAHSQMASRKHSTHEIRHNPRHSIREALGCPKRRKDLGGAVPILPMLEYFLQGGEVDYKQWALCAEQAVNQALAPDALKGRRNYMERELPSRLSVSSPIGEGVSGVVFDATLEGEGWSRSHKSIPDASIPKDRKVVAKYIQRKQTTGEKIRQEIIAMIRTYSRQPNGILRIFDIVVENPDYWIIILERADGDMFSWMSSLGPYNSISEAHIKCYLQEVIQAVLYMGEHDIYHRDIKLENLLYFKRDDGHISVKLGDFGHAIYHKDQLPPSGVLSQEGTLLMLPPGMFRGRFKGPWKSANIKFQDRYALAAVIYEMAIPFKLQPKQEEDGFVHRILTPELRKHISKELAAIFTEVLEPKLGPYKVTKERMLKLIEDWFHSEHM
ncbi:kinase-like domain-containing protein [Piptocephalis cylindrospora]|uniref:Kinase-like domain-containing protein n=1 Tax=Piptocephalis cylindrospora TaxID=1907219 RepID=A0A4P9Y8J9_9FUNG|nr:kinase-like domain-containing protein [Piptocephalis cylindrospora]|eukprot:RKP15428.1 kinase-like domain-containing protein [Piptocephalis cylindrospora]